MSLPRGAGDEARRFYGDALGLHEVPEPQSWAGRGGCWFRVCDGEVVVAEIHGGIDEPFGPATEAHPGLVCDSLQESEATAERIERGGCEITWAGGGAEDVGHVDCH